MSALYFGIRLSRNAPCNEWTRDAGAEKVLSLINRAALKHREDKIAREFLTQIFNDAFGRASAERFLRQTVELFFLADIGAERDDLRLIILFQPGENDRGVETAGVCEDNFHER